MNASTWRMHVYIHRDKEGSTRSTRSRQYVGRPNGVTLYVRKSKSTDEMNSSTLYLGLHIQDDRYFYIWVGGYVCICPSVACLLISTMRQSVYLVSLNQSIVCSFLYFFQHDPSIRISCLFDAYAAFCISLYSSFYFSFRRTNNPGKASESVLRSGDI